MTKLRIRRRLTVGALLLSALAPACTLAQTTAAWPTKPIRVINPFPAGGQLDVVMRIVAERMSASLGQPIVVENRVGADGKIGTEQAAQAAPDGHTWMATSVPFTTQVSLQQVAYHPVRDFSGAALLGTSSFVLAVPPSVPARTLKEFIAYAKSRPGELSYGSASTGSVVHLSSEMFLRSTGTRMLRIPYQGMNTAMPDLISGRTQFMNLGLLLALPQVQSGKLRALAVLDPDRNPLLPDVPSIAEEGFPDLAVSTWFGVLVPSRTPREIVRRINAEAIKALQQPEVLSRLQTLGIDPVKPHTPESFDARIKADVARWAALIKDADIKAD